MKAKVGADRRFRVKIVFDGGSRGNPGPTYGSFLVSGDGLPRRPVERLTWGSGTNNEAEYRALIGGLKDLLKELVKSGIDPAQVDLLIAGDSRLVLCQLEGSWKAKSPRMRKLRDEALPLMERFGKVSLVHQDRLHSVRILGH